jgi:hypothetical protein
LAILWLSATETLQGLHHRAYMVGYGFFRFVIEYFREPDAEPGLRIRWGRRGPPRFFFSPQFFHGQILCALMIVGCVAWWSSRPGCPKREPSPTNASGGGRGADRRPPERTRRQRRRLKKGRGMRSTEATYLRSERTLDKIRMILRIARFDPDTVSSSERDRRRREVLFGFRNCA